MTTERQSLNDSDAPALDVERGAPLRGVRNYVARLVSPQVTQRWGPALTLGPILFVLVIVPLLVLLWSSFKPTGLPRDPGFSLVNYRIVYGNPELLSLVWNTVVFAVSGAAISMSIGVPLVWLIERTDLPAQRFFRAIVLIPMAIPPVLLAIAWVMLTSPRTGLFNTILINVFNLDGPPINIFNMYGMAFVQGLALVPAVYLLLAPAFRNMDPALEEAAFTSGASLAHTIRKILLPMLRPSLLAAFIFMTIIGFVVFDVPGVIGLPARRFVLSTQVFRYLNQSPTAIPQYGAVGALTVSFLVLLILLAVFYQRMTKDARRFVTITGKNFRPMRFQLRRWTVPAVAAVSLYFVVSVIFPLAILFWTSLLPYLSGVSAELAAQASFNNYRQVFSNPRLVNAARNTVFVGVMSATALAAIATLVAWVLVRTKAAGRRVMDVVAFIPAAISGIMLGVSLIFVALAIGRWVPIYGTVWVIALAYVINYLAYGSRLMMGVMFQMHPELEEAARTSGAGIARTFRRVTFPLMSPAILAVWIYVMSRAMRELSAALLLQGRENVVMSVLLWNYWEGGQAVLASTVGVLLLVAMIVLVGGWQWLSGRFGVRE